MSASDPWHRALADLVTRSHRLPPDELPTAVNDVLRPLGVRATVYLVDVEQHHLRPLPERNGPAGELLSIDASLAGRAFTHVEAHVGQGPPPRLWLPIVNGTDRLGLLEVFPPAGTDPADETLRDGCLLIAGLVGHLVTTKSGYGDNLHHARRSRPMDVSAEVLWEQLPPLTFASADTAINALLEPAYEVGGDAFDYSLAGGTVSMAILDGVGHGLPAVLTTSVALGALRAARRTGADLPGIARTIDEAITATWSDARFVTGILAEFDTRTGVLRYVEAGHPPPVLLRRGRAVRTLSGARQLPLGLGHDRAGVAQARLEPGDRLLLHTDGVTEARDAAGELFGLSRLADLAERHIGSGLPGAEILRRLSHAVAAHRAPRARGDDATLMLLEWSPEAARSSEP
ncbi:PP2C family protein-serine/threonine phosphatase [Micromonospora endolithica]|uniref:Serine/threonine-protein phosphatase n=1 Tax=Micromonospora endolithica TaxID=230091 RepID=A0A3A9ZMP6_9ACTN|nr:PP2C family protein-serine/threonine phosphatase [Micromonospora endolithica]RKN49455.1 serine/threonine-protein phosphatase [Micromonospora endolithica]TWJ23656.1 stage II sporulation protein E [Micromonospora endolithica]